MTALRWSWNVLLYPLAFLVIALFAPLAHPLLSFLDSFMGFVIYGLPAVIVALALLAFGFRFAPRGSHRPLAIGLPLVTFAAWLLFLRPLIMESWFGVAVIVVSFLGVGLATRVPQPSPPN